MYNIPSSSKINYYLNEHHIMSFFGSCQPVFTLHHYLPGELLASPFEETRFLQFIVEGTYILYKMPTDDSFSMIKSPFYEGASIIGEVELIDADFETFFVEAKTDVYTLALSLDEYQERLLEDNTFLRFVCRTLSAKLSSVIEISNKAPLRDQLLKYFAGANQNEPVRNITNLSYLFHTSIRQLTRTLNTLCEEGYLERTKKGVYLITDKINQLGG